MRTCIRFSRKPDRRLLSLAACLAGLLWLSGCSSLNRDIPVGTVLLSEGTPAVIRNNRSYLLAPQSRLYEGDILQNDGESRLVAQMSDQSVLSLAYDTHLVINRYRPDTFTPMAKFTITRGAGRLKTGNISADRLGTFVIQTPVAVIETEEAEFWFGLIFGTNTLDLLLLNGDRVDVVNRHGTTKLKRAGLGTRVRGRSAPQVPRPWPENKLINALNSTELAPP